MSDKQHREKMVDRGWDQMNSLLDREMPTDKVGFWPYWWMAGIGILLLGLLGGYIWLQNDDSSKVTEEIATYSENTKFGEKESKDVEYENESMTFESDGTVDNENSTSIDSDPGQPVQRQPLSNKDLVPSQSTPINKTEPQLHVQRTDDGIEQLEKAGFHHVEVDEEEVRDKKQSVLDPLASVSLSLLPMGGILPEGNPQIKTTVEDGYAKSISPIVNLSIGTNLIDNTSLTFRAGLNYSFNRRWSTSTLLGYQLSHIRAENTFISSNIDRELLGSGINIPADESTQYSTQLTFGNITQHLLTIGQRMNYRFLSRWSVYMGASMAYEAFIQSEGSIQENYPVFVGNDQLQYRNRTLDANEFNRYSADWYGMLELGAEYRIHNNWSLNAGISTLQSLHADKDYLGLNNSRRIILDLGIKWDI